MKFIKEAKQFADDLGRENEEFFNAISDPWAKCYWAEKMPTEAVIIALRSRYWNEYVGTEVIAKFMLIVDNPQLKMMVGRQVGDEAKHAICVGNRIKSLGGELEEPLPEQLDFYKTLESFEYPEEFFAAQQFTVETQSIKRNNRALETLDDKTAAMFKEHINDDEVFHARLGYLGLLHYCTTPEAQDRARTAARIIREKHVAMSLATKRKISELGQHQEVA